MDDRTRSAMAPWLIYEHRDDEGCSMAMHYRLNNERRLTPRELAWLDVQDNTRLGIWRVRAVERGRSVTLQNVITGSEHVVIERMGSKTLGIHELVLARVITFDGIAVANCLHPIGLSPREGHGLTEALRQEFGINIIADADPSLGPNMNMKTKSTSASSRPSKTKTPTPRLLRAFAGGRELSDADQERIVEALIAYPGFGKILLDVWQRFADARLNAPLPKLMTTDGEELVPIEDTFEILDIDDDEHASENDNDNNNNNNNNDNSNSGNNGDSHFIRRQVYAALLTLPYAEPDYEPELEPEPDSEHTAGEPGGGKMAKTNPLRIVFIRPNPPGSTLETTVLGTAEVIGKHVVMQTQSRERAARFREQIERACGPLVRFASRKEMDPADLMASIQTQSAQPRLALHERERPPPEALAAMRELKARYMASWCDSPLPALDGKTPRQAAKSRNRKLRAELELALREIEQRESRLHESEQLDLGHLRKELGLASA